MSTMLKPDAANAAASASTTNTTRDRSKSFGHKLALDLKKVKSREGPGGGQTTTNTNMPFTPPLPATAHTAGTGASVATSRRIRAVPPSAAFDPPTPPSSPEGDGDHAAVPSAAPVTGGTIRSTHTAGTGGTGGTSRRPRLRMRYSSSDSDMSEDDTDSEEEVPWWTFTNLGMAKMRARVAGERSRANGHAPQRKATTIAEAAAEIAAAEAESHAGVRANRNGEARGTPARPGARAWMAAGAGSGAISGGESDGKERHAYSYSQYRDRMRDRFHRKGSRDDSSPTPPSRPTDRGQPISTSALESSSAPVPVLGPPITGAVADATASAAGSTAINRHSHHSAHNLSDLESHLPPVSPDAARKRSKPSPIRSLSHFTSDHIFRRASDRSDSHSHNTSDADREAAPKRKPRFAPRRAFTRSNSAPGSPMGVEELVESPQTGATPMEGHTPDEHGQLPLGAGLPQDTFSHSLPAIVPHRQLSVESSHGDGSPTPGRLRAGHVSDTEAHIPKRHRLKSRLSRLHSSALSSEAEGDGEGDEQAGGEGDRGMVSDSGNATPRAGPMKMRRMNTAQLKIRLPPPISQTLAHGWPHAGSWQDALREEKDRADLAGGGSVKVKGKGKRTGSYQVRLDDRRSSAPDSANALTGAGTEGVSRDVNGEGVPQSAGEDALTPTPVSPKTPKRVGRRKTRRMRRYREALVPPTPNGLGFEPRNAGNGVTENGPAGEAWKEGHTGAGEFSWSTPTAVPEGDELSRVNTRATGNAEKTSQGQGIASEKGAARARLVSRSKGKKKGLGMRRITTATRYIDPWRTRFKRTMFLDARVTIYIRVLTIIVVTVALALAITIRQSLINIHLPGLIGPSTILIIAFSCLTLLHGMMAIYREYVGKPIGLWGLRSKMLWVCLDIAFVALWSSVLSLSINDYISTPLECDRGYPWWTAGLSGGYARLLQDLGIDPAEATTGTGSAITGVDLIKATLGIVLPDEVIESTGARNICYRQRGCISLTLLSMLLYGGNMVLSLFRIFETVRRHAQQERPPVMV